MNVTIKNEIVAIQKATAMIKVIRLELIHELEMIGATALIADWPGGHK